MLLSRSNSLKYSVCTGDDKAVGKEELGKGRQQVGESRSRLLKLKTERDLDVSAVRVTGDERESQRRGREEDQRKVKCSLCTPAHTNFHRWSTFRLVHGASLFKTAQASTGCKQFIASKRSLPSSVPSFLFSLLGAT